MRSTLLLATAAFASLAATQQPQGYHEDDVWQAYRNLRTNDSLRFSLTGADTVGKVSKPVHVDLFWRLSYDPRTGRKTKAEVELDVYEPTAKGEEISYRIVGDGTNLYRYDVAKRTLSTTTYGFYGEVPPAKYEDGDAPKLISQIRAVTPGLATYLARVLAEVNPVGDLRTSRFNSWDPGTVALDFNEAWARVPIDAKTRSGAPKKRPAGFPSADVLLDPVSDALYLRGDPGRSRWFFYRVDQDVPTGTMAINLQDIRALDEDPPLWTVGLWRITKATNGRFLNLDLAVRAEAPPDWAFKPYTGTQAAAFRRVTRSN